MSQALLPRWLASGVVAVLCWGGQAVQAQMWVKGVQSSKALTVFSEPGQKTENAPGIPPEQIKAMGRFPVLAESGVYIQIQLSEGNKVWILSEKVQLDRQASCGQGSPGDVITVIKKETNAARGVGEACGGKK